MSAHGFRVAIVGAATLRGKEVADALGESVFAGSEIALLDEVSAIGQLESVGDEVSFVKAVEPDSFDRQDFVFFAGAREQTEKLWRDAQSAGATVIDLSQALDGENVITMFPWQEQPAQARLDTSGVLIAHPVAQILALLAERTAALAAVEFLSANVLEPASQQDRAGMDELHQQTVKLLSFQPLPTEIYNAQLAFNIMTGSTGEARFDLQAAEEMVLRQYAIGGDLLAPLLLQIAQAPVFHAYVIAVHIRMAQQQTLAAMQAAIEGPHLEFVPDADPPEWPSNLSASGQSEILIKLRSADGRSDRPHSTSRDFRLWIAADNLRISAITAVEAAARMRHLRPRGEVQ